MSKDELLQRCADTIAENCTREDLLWFCFQLVAANYETTVLAVADTGDSYNMSSLLSGEPEDCMIAAGLVFDECREALHGNGDN